MINIQKHGARRVAEEAIRTMDSSDSLFAVSLDDHGDLYVRRADLVYKDALPDAWLVGTYRRGVRVRDLCEALNARGAELRQIYRRVSGSYR